MDYTIKGKPLYKLPKKVRFFDAFSGIGCQRIAFEKAKIDYEVVGTSEIDKFALNSYGIMFGENKNYGDIRNIKGKDLPQMDMFIYGFPCVDVSIAGTLKGLNENTESGLVHEVLRILKEMKEVNNLPQVLIMENVVNLIGKRFIKDFEQIQKVIADLGYTNYTFTLNAKNFNVPQNRNRVFMVSILGDYMYYPPTPVPLTKKLKDFLETNVDESFDVKKFPYNEEKQCYIIPENSVMGSQKAYDGDGVHLNRPASKRGVVMKDIIQTITTKKEDAGVVDGKRLRYLTPRERWRLMGIPDKYFDLAKQINSDLQLYKQAGNGLVVDVFAKILEQMK